MGAMACPVCGNLRKLGSWAFTDDPHERLHRCQTCGDPERWDDDARMPYTGRVTDQRHAFTDPVSGATYWLHVGDTAGIEHPACVYRAEVYTALDAFFCRHCGHTGRVSGAWVLGMIAGPTLNA